MTSKIKFTTDGWPLTATVVFCFCCGRTVHTAINGRLYAFGAFCCFECESKDCDIYGWCKVSNKYHYMDPLYLPDGTDCNIKTLKNWESQ
jgi:hypothetical protein